MSKQGLAWTKLNDYVSNKTGMHLHDFSDVDMYMWIDDDMTEKEIEGIIPDMAWDVLDNAGMSRSAVNRICYGEDCDE